MLFMNFMVSPSPSAAGARGFSALSVDAGESLLQLRGGLPTATNSNLELSEISGSAGEILSLLRRDSRPRLAVAATA
jgi:hypothetical protein